MILDVGCGNRPTGTVNVDSFAGETVHRWKRKAIEGKKVQNFIVADGKYLPFRDRVFMLAQSFHTLEHIKDFELMMKEMERVALGTIIVVPFSYFGSFGFLKKQGHKHFFFSGTFKERGYRVKITIKWVKPELVKGKRFPIAMYPMFEIFAWKTNDV